MSKNVKEESPIVDDIADANSVHIDASDKAVAEVSALDVLIGAKSVRQQEVINIPKRDGLAADLSLTIVSLTDREFRDVSTQAEKSGARNNRHRQAAKEAEIDTNLFMSLIVAKGVVDPSFGDPAITAAQGVNTAEQVVQKVLLPGEIAKVAELIMDLSGFNDNNVEIAKN